MIKNIIFDFGDIFINLDKQGTYKAMAALGVTEITQEMIDVYHQYEKGLITTEQFIAFYFDKFGIPKEDLVNAWNAVLLDFPQSRLDFLKKIAASKKYRLFLLSNTNDLHIKSVIDSVGVAFFNEFKNCFEKFYLSHEIHLRKPNKDIYEFVIESNKLSPEETFFIDDTEENTIIANSLGIKSWNLNPNSEDVVDLFSKKEFN